MSSVHSTHCCLEHGCKYGDEDCPVVSGREIQEFRCEKCCVDYGFLAQSSIELPKGTYYHPLGPPKRKEKLPEHIVEDQIYKDLIVREGSHLIVSLREEVNKLRACLLDIREKCRSSDGDDLFPSRDVERSITRILGKHGRTN